jgi:mitochondrial distribution and morphology protein 31
MSHKIGQKLNVFRQSAGPLLFHDVRASANIGLANRFRQAFLPQIPFQSESFHSSHVRHQSKVNKKVASGSLLLLGLSSNSAVENGATRAGSSGGKKATYTRDVHHCCRQGILTRTSRQLWKRALHTKRDAPAEKSSNDLSNEKVPKQPKDEHEEHQLLGRQIRERLPNFHPFHHQFHRPTKEELLAAATGFWSRLRIRFKWFSIRSVRPFNFDEISALFSWVLLGHLLWVILGTTTFFSLLILAINTVFAQGKIRGLSV